MGENHAAVAVARGGGALATVRMVTLDSSDSDPARFWTYVLEALRSVVPGVGAGSLALLRAPGVDLVSELLPVLVDELDGLQGPLVLALDDYHQLEGAAVHATLRRLLDYLPANLEIAIASRTEPPLGVARLRARGQLIEIDADELRFSVDEARALINDRLSLRLSDVDVSRLCERAEGWPAGIYLAALSLRNRPDRHEFIARFAGDDRHIVDYLGEEVLSGLEPELRTLLLRTSVLERVSGPLCDAVAQVSGSALATASRQVLVAVTGQVRQNLVT